MAMPYKDPADRLAAGRRSTARRTPAQRAAASARQKAWFAALSPEQKAARNARAAAYHAANLRKNPEKYRARGRRKNGILDATGEVRTGRCLLCAFEGRLVCDHDHTTGLTRGWLCSRCNGALGKLGDTVESLQRAVDYLTAARRAHADSVAGLDTACVPPPAE